MCKKHNIKLQRSFDKKDPPAFTRYLVAFNGADDRGYEDFQIKMTFDDRHPQPDDKGRLFEFCKTDHRPYDLAVLATLVAFRHHFGNDFVVTSDAGRMGDGFHGKPTDEDWTEAMAMAQKKLGYGDDFVLGDSTDPVYVPEGVEPPKTVDYEAIAKRFEEAGYGHGEGIGAGDIADLGLIAPAFYKTLAGFRVKTADWSGLCQFVFEKLTEKPMAQCPMRGTGFRSQWYGKSVAEAIRAKFFRPADPTPPYVDKLAAFEKVEHPRFVNRDECAWNESTLLTLIQGFVTEMDLHGPLNKFLDRRAKEELEDK